MIQRHGPTHLSQPAFSEEGAEAHVIPGLLTYGRIVPGEFLDGGEIVILTLKPSVWFMVLVSMPWLLAAGTLLLAAPLLDRLHPMFSQRAMMQLAVVITVARLTVALLQWGSRLFVLTNRRVMSYRGIAQVALFEAPLVHIRNTYVNIRWFERLCNAGSIGFSLTGSKSVDAWWDGISNPDEVHAKVRRAIERALDHHTPF